MKILYFDCSCGISGDMALKALMEISGREKEILGKMEETDFSGGEGEKEHHHGHGRSYSIVKKLIESSGFSSEAKKYAKEIYAHIAEAEARVHGESLDTVHFHEVGRDEAVKNALGIGMAMEAAAPDRVYASDIYDGTGTVLCSHGEIPVPVPAVMALREKSRLVFKEADVNMEMVTPSGLAGLMGIGAEPAPEDFEPEKGKILKKTEAKGSRDTGLGGLKVYLIESEGRQA
ncbi:MAG TPA: DUF111 family protein [Candidatus Copromorpha excrementigallinarum]|uniref:DUF111 family protein n=1 Tax=Candidatus Allocopromorpha excrementigallinarum TaxID=2840742 RepID=A0A9D1HYJ5_9FIRM|nr:DUF111 family protein [Candidatus Copromorpha excrementigallinarum]